MVIALLVFGRAECMRARQQFFEAVTVIAVCDI